MGYISFTHRAVPVPRAIFRRAGFSLCQQLDDPLTVLFVDHPRAAVSQTDLDWFVWRNRDPKGRFQIEHLIADRHEPARLIGEFCEELGEEEVIGLRVGIEA